MLRRERFWERGLRRCRSHDNGIGVWWDKAWRRNGPGATWGERGKRRKDDGGRGGIEKVHPNKGKLRRPGGEVDKDLITFLPHRALPSSIVQLAPPPPALHLATNPRSTRITSVEMSTFLSAGMVNQDSTNLSSHFSKTSAAHYLASRPPAQNYPQTLNLQHRRESTSLVLEVPPKTN